MRIAVFEVESWEMAAFADLEAEGHRLSYHPEPLEAANAADFADAEAVCTFIYSAVDACVLDALPHLCLVATRSTGYDHIDLETCRERGVTVCNVPSYGENTVAEHVFGLLLTISHNLTEAVDRTRRGDFSPQGLQGFDLRGRTLGVIGTGAIGRHVLEIARGFGMERVAYDKYPDPAAAERLGFRYRDFDSLLGQADVISLHVPETPETRGMIGEAAFARMREGVVLINTARGGLVDVHALLRALAEGKVRAAGLDVLPEEPVIREESEVLRSLFQQEYDYRTLLADHVLLRMRNVFITPHSAFNTREALQRILDVSAANLRGFARGQPRNVVAGPSAGG
ncbi:hydroxyacid dehydrogenase [Thiohalorhabdus denitrificans]|uniref:D-lactate dehydrogenase n=1 Tax=Thiohalorhabdus denitrificans TaxID=381306 RepID=A0A0P9GKD7_9GAMM|nr:hydroxyacid dehydrogenase [Thiohalorhabdus denitrificans]KPV40588.1 hydroxyacid dehydrogenase [Thiohalorhabdus denitrificans]SCY50363.1 D-lactate dehydrogenase [Thiohalorhabdus denitrificans]